MLLKHIQYIIFLFTNLLFSQSYSSRYHSFPFELTLNEKSNLSLVKYGDLSPYFNQNKHLVLSYSSYFSSIKGHRNIDNYGVLSSQTGLNLFNSMSLKYQNKWLFVRVEPFQTLNRPLSADEKKLTLNESYQYLNHHTTANQKNLGFRQSGLFLTFYDLSIGFSNFNYWLSPGFHNSIHISSNPNGMKSFMLGTIKDKKINNYLSFNIKTIVSPYKNINNTDLYFSALSAKINFHYNPKVTIGFNRSYYSGNFSNLSEITNFKSDWDIYNAYKLLFEPLFGSSKKGISYTTSGTPGFDPWDEFLSGFINIYFPKEKINLYTEIASDDNRANFTDLRAHWDHTLGYLVGLNKIFQKDTKILLLLVEYLSLLPSNTFNPIFYRGGPNSPVYYTKDIYDYSSFHGKLIGAHSGTSSDDLFLLIGIGNYGSMAYFSYSKERHGVKSIMNHEIKHELIITLQKNFFQNHKIFLKYEYEKINNYEFLKPNVSDSQYLWMGYSFIFH